MALAVPATAEQIILGETVLGAPHKPAHHQPQTKSKGHRKGAVHLFAVTGCPGGNQNACGPLFVDGQTLPAAGLNHATANLTGDLSGSLPNPTISNLQSTPLSISRVSLVSGMSLQWNGSAWVPTAATGNVGGGGAGIVNQVPQWSGTSNLNAGLPVAVSTSANSIVQTGSGGFISNTFISGLPSSALANTGVGSGVYTNPVVTVNSQGQITAISTGAGVPTTGTSGGLPYYNTTTSLLSSGTLTLNLPILGGGAGGSPVSGSVSGTAGNALATTSGTLTNGHCVAINSTHDLVDAGGACTTGGGGGTVSTGTANQLAYYAVGGTTVSGLTTANSAVLVTNSSGVPSESTTLPSGLTIPGYVTGLTSGTANITVGSGSTPSISTSLPLDVESANSAFAIVTGDNTKAVERTNTATQTDTIAQAGSTGFATGWSAHYFTNTVGNTITPTTSTIGGLVSLKTGVGQGIELLSDGTNYEALLGVPPPPAQSGLTVLYDNFQWATPTVSLSGAVTGTGSLPNISTSYPSESANQFLAGPTTGAAAVASFRGIVSGDLTSALTTPPPIGGTTPNTVAATSLSTTGAANLGGTLTTNVTGSTQCLQVNSTGVVSGTGSSCGSGGGGSGTSAPLFMAVVNSGVSGAL